MEDALSVARRDIGRGERGKVELEDVCLLALLRAGNAVRREPYAVCGCNVDPSLVEQWLAVVVVDQATQICL